MSHDDFRRLIEGFARGVIRRKVGRLVGRAGFAPQDRDDLEQELLLGVMSRLGAFDPARSHPKLFLACVIDKAVANVLRRRKARKRGPRRVASLHATVTGEGGGRVELGQVVGESETPARRGRPRRGLEQTTGLAADLAEALYELPPELRDLAEQLKTLSVSDAARERGVPRSTLYEKVRQIRARFERAGLRVYLE